jgi:serine/threonine-protein kinase
MQPPQADAPGIGPGLIGRTLGNRYRILAVLGSGGMATVYRGFDERLDRAVALKILHASVAADPVSRRRFRREAEYTAGLSSHPYIVSVHDVDQDGDLHYLVMDYVTGSNLKELIVREAPLTTERAFRIGAQVASALAFAHSRELIHRDIKAQNILIGPEDTAMVTDFGIARQLDATQMTLTGTMLGTAAYLSPEQAQGKEATAACDVYALGVVLFEMLTGRLPFEAESSIALAMKHIHEPPISPDRLNPAVDPRAAAIVLRALAKDPLDRYRDGAALEAALRPGPPSDERSTQPELRTPHSGPPAILPGARLPVIEAAAVSSIPDPVARSGDSARARKLPVGGPMARFPLPPAVRTVRPRRRLPVLLGVLGLLGALAAGVLVAMPGLSHGHLPATSWTFPGVGASAPSRSTVSSEHPTPTPTAAQPTPQARLQAGADVMSSAIDQARSDIADGVWSGDVEPDVADELNSSLDDLQAQIESGDTSNLSQSVAELRRELAQDVDDGTITPDRAQLVDQDLAGLQQTT